MSALPVRPTDARSLDVPCFADIEPVAVDWLWPGRIPLGKITFLDGDPGVGKSSIALDLAARLSVGARTMPDGSPGLYAPTLFASLEDDIADTLRPRLEAMGGDAQQVYGTPTLPPQDNSPVLPDDVDAIRAVVEEYGVRLVVLDPVVAFLSPAHNAHRDQDVRGALAPLATMAAETGAAVVCIRHLNKGTGPALYRGGGSIGMAAAARSVLLAARDPEDETGGRCILASVKCNLAAPPPSLAYRLDGTANALRVQWGGASALRADALVAQPESAEDRSAIDDAKAFILDALAAPRPAREMFTDARREGIADRTLKRAKAALGIRSVRDGFGSAGRYVWALPDSIEGHEKPWPPMESGDPLTHSKATTSHRGPAIGGQWGLAPYGEAERRAIIEEAAPPRGAP